MNESTLWSLPLDPALLMMLKYFVVLTCVVFWMRLGFHWLFRQHLRQHRRRHDED